MFIPLSFQTQRNALIPLLKLIDGEYGKVSMIFRMTSRKKTFFPMYMQESSYHHIVFSAV